MRDIRGWPGRSKLVLVTVLMVVYVGCGAGVSKFANGNKYEGEWEGGKIHGAC
jgi:uncharacterized spore protein YtfJ